MSTYSKSTGNVQKLTTMGLLCAIAYVCTFILHDIPIFPSAPYLSLDPKDAVIAIGGFMFGPLSALAMTVVVCLVEMVTISSTGIIGLIMNILSTGVFVVIALLIYAKRESLTRAIVGLVVGTTAMTAVMILWNFLITPLYTGVPREAIVPMLPTVFLPFNLLKGAANSAIALLLYKTTFKALQKAKLLPKKDETNTAKINPVLMIASALVLISCVLVVLVIKGIF